MVIRFLLKREIFSRMKGEESLPRFREKYMSFDSRIFNFNFNFEKNYILISGLDDLKIRFFLFLSPSYPTQLSNSPSEGVFPGKKRPSSTGS